MYNEFYGFCEKPFSLTPDPHFLYLSSVHRKALAYLNYGLDDRKGFITVTGEIGAGKTTLVRALLRHIDPKTIVSRIVNTTVSSLQLLKMIVRDFSIEVTSSAKEDLLESLNDFLLEQYSLGHNAVIIIDEAQNLKTSTLEEIRLLSNLETEKDKLLQIILVGQPELRQTLAQPELKQLCQRITVNYHISPLSSHEVAEYIMHRAKVAGARDPDLFSQEAMQEIAMVSKGIPRVINIVCDAALVTGYVEEKQHIDVNLVREVTRDLNLENTAKQVSSPGTPFSDDHENQSIQQDLEQLCNHYHSKYTTERDLEDKAKHLQEQMEQINIVMSRMAKLEEELEERAERIKSKEEELGI